MYSKIDLSQLMVASAAVSSKAVVPLLLIHCLLMLQQVVWVLFLLFNALCLFYLCYHVAEEGRGSWLITLQVRIIDVLTEGVQLWQR